MVVLACGGAMFGDTTIINGGFEDASSATDPWLPTIWTIPGWTSSAYTTWGGILSSNITINIHNDTPAEGNQYANLEVNAPGPIHSSSGGEAFASLTTTEPFHASVGDTLLFDYRAGFDGYSSTSVTIAGSGGTSTMALAGASDWTTFAFVMPEFGDYTVGFQTYTYCPPHQLDNPIFTSATLQMDNVRVVPEPSTIALLFTASLGGLLWWRRRR
jgi:hypothetical protein